MGRKFKSSQAACEIFTLTEALPARPGGYLLILENTRRRRLRVGSLGRQAFAPGWYLYLGSARGPGGVRARAGRHIRGDGRARWHIDWLRAVSEPRELWYSEGLSQHETLWYQQLQAVAGLHEAVPGFGASDSRAATHLFYSAARPDWDLLGGRLAQVVPGPVRRLCLDSGPEQER